MTNKQRIMNTPQMQELVKISAFSKSIPSSKKMVTVASLLTVDDRKRIETEVFGTIAVKIAKQAFFLSPIHKVPSTAVIQRDEQEHVLGIPTVTGG